METQVTQQHVAGLGTAAAILSGVDVEAVQMLITPGKDDLQDRVEVRQGRIAADEQAAPDQRTDASKDHTQLVDAWLTHGQRVMQAPCGCKTSPRNLTLS
jgi:hypothetical protein